MPTSSRPQGLATRPRSSSVTAPAASAPPVRSRLARRSSSSSQPTSTSTATSISRSAARMRPRRNWRCCRATATVRSARHSRFTVGAGAHSLIVDDFNNDAVPDMASANVGAGTLSILLGDGNGGFAVTNTALPTINRLRKVGDLNGDGFIDLVIADAPSGTRRQQVFFGDGLGRLRDSTRPERRSEHRLDGVGGSRRGRRSRSRLHAIAGGWRGRSDQRRDRRV